MSLFSVKMRASRGGVHVSGAERIVEAGCVGGVCDAMTRRALSHPKGQPDEIHVTVAAVDEEAIVRIPFLPVTELECASPAEARELVVRMLAEHTIHAERAWQLLTEVRDMRGAVLLDAATGARLEADNKRGVRVTNMDAAAQPETDGKARVSEALVLASKVAHHPAVLAEVCISDDPDYTTGYLAASGYGYIRIPNMKPIGSPIGGRVFVVAESGDLVDYLERTPVVVGQP